MAFNYDFLLLAKCLVATWFFTSFDPVQDKLINYFVRKEGAIYNGIFLLLSCWKCQSFWVTLAVTFDFFQAAALSFVVWVFQKMSAK